MTKSVIAAGSLAILALLLASSSAHATNRFGVAGVVNKTDRVLNFGVKEGDAQGYSEKHLADGYQMAFAHRYAKPDENSSPTLYISFDSDLRSGKQNVSRTEYKLDREAAVGDTCEEGAQYWFEYEGSNHQFIKLSRKRK
jgi:hypothetical protein